MSLPVVLGVLIFALILGAVYFYDRSSRARARRTLGILGRLVLRFPAWSVGIAVAVILGGFYLLGPKDEYVPPPPPPTTTEAPEPRPVGWYESFCGGDGRSRYSCGVGLVDTWCVYVAQAPYEYELCNANTTPPQAWKGSGWTPPAYEHRKQAFEYVQGALPCVEELGAGYLCEPKVTVADSVPF